MLLALRLCVKDTVGLPDKPLAEKEAEGVTLIEKDPEPVFVAVLQSLLVMELLLDCAVVELADALKLLLGLKLTEPLSQRLCVSDTVELELKMLLAVGVAVKQAFAVTDAAPELDAVPQPLFENDPV